MRKPSKPKEKAIKQYKISELKKGNLYRDILSDKPCLVTHCKDIDYICPITNMLKWRWQANGLIYYNGHHIVVDIIDNQLTDYD